ncbi:MAG: TonB-dependent receptor plug domain-containing protein, partial [Flavisolibacter sp.]
MRRIVSLLSMLVLCTTMAFAQTRTVTGRVTDAQGKAVPFASVTIKGTTSGVSADETGAFSIQASPNAVLVFSAAGFQTSEVNIGNQTTITGTINSQSALTEVVVTALGQSRSRAKVGYTTQTFNTEAINRAAPVSALEGLQGKVAGADISHVGGPGASTKVVLRGYGNIAGANNQPLYVIDGVPLNDARFGASSVADFGNAASDINPNDIETITILKGTAAASLYGSLARNGAIMITTKRGRSGKLRIDYNGSANFSEVGKLPEFQKSFGQGWGGTFILSENGSWGPRLDGRERLWGSIVDNSQLIKPFSFVNDNMRDFYNTGTEYNNTIGLSGGNETTTFYFSYGNVTSDGVLPSKSDYLQRNTLALRTNSRFKNLNLNTSFNYVNRKM